MHIIFKKDYKLNGLPDGFIKSSELIFADITGQTEHAKKMKKTKLLKDLSVWVESLESRNPADNKK